MRLQLIALGSLTAAAVIACLPFLARPSFSWVEMNAGLQVLVVALAAGAFYQAGLSRGFDNAVRLFVLAFSISYAAESISAHYGWLSGARYAYHPAIVPVLPSGIPLAIPLMWFGFANTALFFLRPLAIRTSHGISWPRAILKAALAALFLVALDLVLDPLGVALQLWSWAEPGGYFGTPYRNFLGWFLVGFAICVSYILVEIPRPAQDLRGVRALEALTALVTLVLEVIVIAACWIHLDHWLPIAVSLPLLGSYWVYWMGGCHV